MASIEFLASCAARMFVEESPFLKGKGREVFLLNIFCFAGACSKGTSLCWWVGESRQ
jgi:hypothetical protein